MQGVEGQIFGPMSRTYAYALIGAVIATFTVTPVLSSVLLPARVTKSRPSWSGISARVYKALLPLAVRDDRRAAIIAAVFPADLRRPRPRLGTEFLPKLEEGNMWIRAMMPPTIALEAGIDTVARIRDIIKSYPAVQHCVLRARARRGRHRSGRIVHGGVLCAAEALRRWPNGMTKEGWSRS